MNVQAPAMAVTGFDPTSKDVDHSEQPLAPRPRSLDGEVLGVLCNGLGSSEVLMDALVEELRATCQFADVIKVVKDSVSVPPNPQQWARLVEGATVAIVGFGGCGSCSARAMRDAMELEWAGIAPVYIGHEALEPSARAISRLCGQPDYPQILASLQPPGAAWPVDDCKALAAQLAPAVHRALIDPSASGAIREAGGKASVGSAGSAVTTGQPNTAAPKAQRLSFESPDDLAEHYFANGWTDGLPVVAPTPARVAEFLDHVGLAADTVIGTVATRDVVVTAELAAINAVMAGCLPEYFPVVVAALRAHLSDLGNSHCTTASLMGPSQAIVVNGPIRDRLGIAGGQACMGPGFRANATIGRAVRLVIRNVCRAIPGELDRAAFSTPERYSFCFGEDEAAGAPWLPLHVQRGFDAADDVVTVLSVYGVATLLSYATSPEGLLDDLVLECRGNPMLLEDQFLGDATGFLVAFGAEHRRILHEGGWSKADIQRYVYPRLRAPSTGPKDLRCKLPRAAQLLIVAAGGPGTPETRILRPHLAAPISQKIASVGGHGSPAHHQASGSAALDNAIREIASLVAADGARLEIRASDPPALTFELVLDDAACADCVMPRPVLEDIFTSRLNEVSESLVRVTVIDPREQPDYTSPTAERH